MALVLIGVFTAAIIALVHEDWIESLVQDAFEYELDNNITDGLMKFAYDQYQCCGVYDVDRCVQNFPPFDGVHCLEGSANCTNGCLTAVWDNMFSPYIQIAAIVLFVLAGIMAFETMMALCVCNQGHGEDMAQYRYKREA